MSKQTEAMKLALEFIERVNKDGWILADFEPQMYATITALREALAEQPAQQNSPWCMKMNGCKTKCEDCPDEVAQPPAQPAPDYAWPTVQDYEADVGFEMNDAFRAAWTIARTTNDIFKQMGSDT